LPRRKLGRPKDPHKAPRRNCTLFLESELLEFIKKELPALNLTKVATNAIITQILYICTYEIRQEELSPEPDHEKLLAWKERLQRFDIYLHRRARSLAKKGIKYEVEANYDLAEYLAIKQQTENWATF
jgi:hypothetical protein